MITNPQIEWEEVQLPDKYFDFGSPDEIIRYEYEPDSSDLWLDMPFPKRLFEQEDHLRWIFSELKKRQGIAIDQYLADQNIDKKYLTSRISGESDSDFLNRLDTTLHTIWWKTVHFLDRAVRHDGFDLLNKLYRKEDILICDYEDLYYWAKKYSVTKDPNENYEDFRRRIWISFLIREYGDTVSSARLAVKTLFGMDFGYLDHYKQSCKVQSDEVMGYNPTFPLWLGDTTGIYFEKSAFFHFNCETNWMDVMEILSYFFNIPRVYFFDDDESLRKIFYQYTSYAVQILRAGTLTGQWNLDNTFPLQFADLEASGCNILVVFSKNPRIFVPKLKECLEKCLKRQFCLEFQDQDEHLKNFFTANIELKPCENGSYLFGEPYPLTLNNGCQDDAPELVVCKHGLTHIPYCDIIHLFKEKYNRNIIIRDAVWYLVDRYSTEQPVNVRCYPAWTLDNPFPMDLIEGGETIEITVLDNSLLISKEDLLSKLKALKDVRYILIGEDMTDLLSDILVDENNEEIVSGDSGAITTMEVI